MTGVEIGALSAICIAAFATLGLQAWRCASSLNKSSDRDELTITIGAFERNGDNIKITNMKIIIKEHDSKYFKDGLNTTKIGSEAVSIAALSGNNSNANITSLSKTLPNTNRNLSYNSRENNINDEEKNEEKTDPFVDEVPGRPGNTHLVMDNSIPVNRMTTNLITLISSIVPTNDANTASDNPNNNQSTPKLIGEEINDVDNPA